MAVTSLLVVYECFIADAVRDVEVKLMYYLRCNVSVKSDRSAFVSICGLEPFDH